MIVKTITNTRTPIATTNKKDGEYRRWKWTKLPLQSNCYTTNNKKKEGRKQKWTKLPLQPNCYTGNNEEGKIRNMNHENTTCTQQWWETQEILKP